MRKQLIILLLISLIYSISYSQENKIDLYRKAKSEIYYKRYENAEKLLKTIISENNREETAYLLLGELNYKQRKYSEAVKHYKEAMKQKSKIASYHIAECYALLNDEISAVEYLKIYLNTTDKTFQSEIKLNSSFNEIKTSKAWINLWKEEHYNNYEKKLGEAQYLIQKGDYNEAFTIIDHLLHKNKRRHKALGMRADILMLTGEYKSAAKSYTLASEIKNKNYIYNSKAALAYFKEEKYNKAYDQCNLAIHNNPYKSDIILLKTKTEIKLKEYNEASETINQFLKYYPDNSEALNLSGTILYNKREYINALEQYNLCLEQTPEKAEYFINRADTYMAVSMYKNAAKDFSMALDLNPKLAEVYYKKGIANIKAFNKEEACSDFKKAQDLGYYKASDYIIKYCK